jgi:hypothetical protein
VTLLNFNGGKAKSTSRKNEMFYFCVDFKDFLLMNKDSQIKWKQSFEDFKNVRKYLNFVLSISSNIQI